MENAIVAVASVSATLIAVWGTILYPRRKERKKVKAEAAHRQEVRDQVLDGIPAVPGMTEGVLPLAERLHAVEDGMMRVASGQALLERRMDEANGTGKRTEQIVREIQARLSPAVEVTQTP
jgi:hypothetical protein